jgi:predicted class III extradiol MEMO1 family dioxygenase
MQWKAAISPHDDYKYAGRLYYESLKGINANTIILMVLHIALETFTSRQNHLGDFTH